jgi:hypothetical protein
MLTLFKFVEFTFTVFQLILTPRVVNMNSEHLENFHTLRADHFKCINDLVVLSQAIKRARVMMFFSMGANNPYHKHILL